MAILHAHVLKTNKVKTFPLTFSITNNNPATKRHNIFAEGRILGYFFYDKEAIS